MKSNTLYILCLMVPLFVASTVKGQQQSEKARTQNISERAGVSLKIASQVAALQEQTQVQIRATVRDTSLKAIERQSRILQLQASKDVAIQKLLSEGQRKQLYSNSLAFVYSHRQTSSAKFKKAMEDLQRKRAAQGGAVNGDRK